MKWNWNKALKVFYPMLAVGSLGLASLSGLSDHASWGVWAIFNAALIISPRLSCSTELLAGYRSFRRR